MIVLSRRYEMEVAHQLTAGVPEHHKCRRLHGHRYVLVIRIRGPLDPDGILIEYADLDAIVKPIIRMVDHHSLNTLNERCSTAQAAAVAANPTVERLADWFATRLQLLHSARAPGADLPSQHALDYLTLEADSRSSVEWRPSGLDVGEGRE